MTVSFQLQNHVGQQIRFGIQERSYAVHRLILSEIKPTVSRLSEEITDLFIELSNELASTGRVRCRALETEEEEDVLQLFLNLKACVRATLLGVRIMVLTI